MNQANYFNPPTNNVFQQQQSPYTNMYARQVAPPGLKGRPVSSLDEARAMAIDFDGSIFFFPDLANGRIYTKQINMDGTASLNMYELKEIPTVSAIGTNNSYVTREEFEAALAAFKASLMQPQPQPQPAPVAKTEIKSF